MICGAEITAIRVVVLVYFRQILILTELKLSHRDVHAFNLLLKVLIVSLTLLVQVVEGVLTVYVHDAAAGECGGPAAFQSVYAPCTPDILLTLLFRINSSITSRMLNNSVVKYRRLQVSL